MTKRHATWHYFLATAMMAILISACTPDAKDNNAANGNAQTDIEEKPEKQRSVPRFEADSAYVYTEKQVAFGPRVPNMTSHTACKNWLAGKLKEFGAEVIEQDFQATAYTGTVLNGTNIIGQYNPEKKKRVLLAAHWDTRHIADKDEDSSLHAKPIDGADDGASGVGALLEIARQIQKNGIDIGIDIIFFDAEDHGEEGGNSQDTWCLGSQYWGKNLHVKNYSAKYGILLDMIGAKDARFPKEGYSMRINPQLVNKIWALAKSMNQGKYFLQSQGGGITDDHYYVHTLAKVPMIDIINLPPGEKTFGFYHHTHDDNMDVIDKETLYAVGQVVLAVLYRESNGTFM